jgi:hypothetical protein
MKRLVPVFAVCAGFPLMTVAKYKGSGSTGDAANFVCSAGF